jgi:hypothetical protein
MHDVFVSYARIDNEPFGPERSAWVTEFTEDLRKRLSQLAGERADVWRDPRLRGNELIWPTIEEALGDAIALVSVVSPRYVDSDSCEREIEHFVARWRERGGLTIGGRTRLFKVLKTHVPRERQPDPLRDINGYDFYREDPDTKRFREIALDPDPQVRRQYWTRLDDLAQDITALLDEAKPAADPVFVYVAQTTRDVRDVRDAVARELKDRGFEVLPSAELPGASEDLQAAIRRDLDRARFSVHVVGARDGFVPEGDTRSVVEIQYALAIERRTPGILWHPAHLDPQAPATGADDAPPSTLVRRLAPTATPEHGFELLKGTLDQLKLRLLARLAQPDAPAVTPAVAAAEALRLYLVHLRSDVAEADRLEAALTADLAAAAGVSRPAMAAVDVSRPRARGTPAELRIDHEARLRSSDLIVIMCAHAEPLWIGAKHQELRRAGAQNLTASERVVFYLTPPGVDVSPFAAAGSLDELLALVRRRRA